MLKNIIFDYGNTIIRYDTREMVTSFGVTDETEIEILMRICFDRKYWDRLDDGTLTQEDFVSGVVGELPLSLKEVGEKICNNWYAVTPIIDGMDTLIKKLKKDGYKLYLLSNICLMLANDTSKFKLYNEYFDGGVMSSPIKLIKPNTDIFQHLLEKYSLKAEECLFVDDLLPNVEGAEKCGIHGFRFCNNAQELEKFIYNS